jgi:hypothetical protein
MIKLKEGDVFEGQIEFWTNGSASLIVQETEIFIYKKNTSNSLHLDTVKVEIFKAEKSSASICTNFFTRTSLTHLLTVNQRWIPRATGKLQCVRSSNNDAAA